MILSKNIKQLVLYLVVGGIATVVEWVAFYIFDAVIHINYAIATIVAFAISTFVNWIAGRLLIFKVKGHVLSELGKIYLTSIAGLIMNLIIMWVAIEFIGISNFVSKMIATCIVFAWNFIIRKLFIYKI